jgi:hypothetical protein
MRFILPIIASLFVLAINALPNALSREVVKRDSQLFTALYNDIDVRFTQLVTALSFFDGAAVDANPVIQGGKDLTSLIRTRVQVLAIQEPLSIGESISLVLKVRSSNGVATAFYDLVAKKKAAFDHAKMNTAAAETLQRNRESFEAISRASQAKLPGVVGGLAKSSDDALISRIMEVERILKETEAPKIAGT